jgi:hypothetical protein
MLASREVLLGPGDPVGAVPRGALEIGRQVAGSSAAYLLSESIKEP